MPLVREDARQLDLGVRQQPALVVPAAHEVDTRLLSSLKLQSVRVSTKARISLLNFSFWSDPSSHGAKGWSL